MARLGGDRYRSRGTIWLTLVLLTVPLAGTMSGGSTAAEGCDLLRQGQILVPDAGAGLPSSEVVEAQIPEACAGVPFELTAGGPADDLDVCWHAADATELACFATPGNEAGTIPNGAVEARIDHFAGADTTYTLRSATYQAPMTLYFHDGTAPQGNAASLFVAGNEMDTSEPSRGTPASTYSIPSLLDGENNPVYNAQWAWIPNTNVTFDEVDLTVTFWVASPSGSPAYTEGAWGVQVYNGEELLAEHPAGEVLRATDPGVPARFDVTFENETFTTDELRVQIDPFYINTEWPHTILYDSTEYPSGATITPTTTTEENPDTTAPTAPVNATSVANGTTQAALAWDPATDDTGIDHYNVYRGTASDNLNLVGQTTATTFSEGELTPDTTYLYEVRAEDAAGNEGLASETVTATTDPLDTQRDLFLHDVGPDGVQFVNELDTPGDNDASGYNALGGAIATAQGQSGVSVQSIADTFPATEPALGPLVLDPSRPIEASIHVRTDVSPASTMTLRLTLDAAGEAIATGTTEVAASSAAWTAAKFSLEHAATLIPDGTLSATIQAERSTAGYVFGYEGDHASTIVLPEDPTPPLSVQADVDTDGILTTGQEVTFSADVLGGQAPVDLTWDLGDGTTATGQSVDHTYTEIGPRQVTVTATDAAGAAAQDSVDIRIRQGDFTTDRVVVAVVDSGINPYHETFQRAGADLPLSSFTNTLDGQTPRTVDLSDAGSYEQRVESDASIYDGISSRELVYLEGTNVLGISFASEGPEPILDPTGHGTATSSTVLATHPDAIIVQVQTTAETLSDAIGWAADQPWIDVLSVSWGAVGNAPVPSATPDHTRQAYDDGKVIVNSAGNDPSPLPTDATDGPWWVLSVTGSQEGGQSKEVLSSNIYPDYVSNYTVTAAAHDSIDGQTRIGGTSFSAPTVAGTVAGIVHELRRDAGHSTGIVGGEIAPGVLNTDIRAALNKTALLPPFEGYVAGINYNGDHAHPPVAPWTTAQWGQVDARIIDPAVQAIQTGDLDVPEEKSEVALYKQATFGVRQAYWG